MPIKKMKTSLFNLLNHKEQKLPKRKKVSAEAKFQQMPQTSISTFTTFSDMRVNLTSGHVPHLAREYRLIRSSGPIEGNATIYTEIAKTATNFAKSPVSATKQGNRINPALMCARSSRASKMKVFDSV